MAHSFNPRAVTQQGRSTSLKNPVMTAQEFTESLSGRNWDTNRKPYITNRSNNDWTPAPKTLGLKLWWSMRIGQIHKSTVTVPSVTVPSLSGLSSSGASACNAPWLGAGAWSLSCRQVPPTSGVTCAILHLHVDVRL